MAKRIRFLAIFATLLVLSAVGEQDATGGFIPRLTMIPSIGFESPEGLSFATNSGPRRIFYAIWGDLGLLDGELEFSSNSESFVAYASALAPARAELERPDLLRLSLVPRSLFDPNLPYGPPDHTHLELIRPRGLRTPEFGGVKGFLEVHVFGESSVSAGISIDF